MITELEIRDLITEVTCTKYIGKLKLLVDSEVVCPNTECRIYSLLLFLDQEQHPSIVISKEYDIPANVVSEEWKKRREQAIQNAEDDFKDYLRSEFKSRQLDRTQYWKLERVEDFIYDD